MPARASAEIQQAIVDTLRAIDGDVRALSLRLKRAKEVPEAVEEIQISIDELTDSKTILQRHRVQLRKWMTQLAAKHEMRGQIGAARTRMEQEIQGIAVLEKSLKDQMSQLDCANIKSADTDYIPSSQEVASSRISAPREAQALELECGSCEEEVKVQSCQLVSGSDLTDELVCKVCYDVVGCEPKLTKCAHLFCGDCLSKWFAAQPGMQTWAQRAHSKGLVPCPVCKEPLNEERDLFTLSKGGPNGNGLLWSMLQQTKIRCVNHSLCKAGGACDWIGEYGSYQDHIRQCENVRVTDTCETSSVGFPMLSSAIAPPSCAGFVQGEPRDRAESDCTWSDFIGEDNGDTSSDGDFTAGEMRECSHDSVTSESELSECQSQGVAKPRKTVRFREGDALVEEIPASEEMTSGDKAVDEAAASEDLINSISALLELKIQCKHKEVAKNVDFSPMQSVQQQSLDPQMNPQKQTEAVPPVLVEKTLMHQQQQVALDMQQRQLSMAAAHAQQVAKWQQAQMSHQTYAAAHWQAAQMQYAAQWKAAQMQYAAQWQAAQMQTAAYAVRAALPANKRK